MMLVLVLVSDYDVTFHYQWFWLACFGGNIRY